MSTYPNIVFLDSKTPVTEDTLATIIGAMLRQGFKITQKRIHGTWQEWNSDNISLTLADAIRLKQLALRYINPELEFEILQELNWNADDLGRDNRIWIQTYTFDTAYFWNSVDISERYSEILLEMGIELYNILRPAFGWIDFNYGIFTTHEDVESVRLPALYWANFFGPRFVDSLGRGRIESAPKWKIKQLPDGGYLYILSSGLGLSGDTVSAESVKAAFGVDKVR
jgi:hypothetical protein